jgi:arylsulfatase A-like enzyme
VSRSSSTFSRRNFIKTCAAGAASALIPAWSAGQSPAIIRRKQPNILLLSTDQWHPDAFSYLGCPYVYTPHSDRIAAMGVDFRRSYATDPVCTPARASWLTGRMPSEHKAGVGAGASELREDLPDIGQWFGDNGYETVHIGKWHVRGRDPEKSFKVFAGAHPAGQYSDQSRSEFARAYLMDRNRDKPFLMHVAMMNPHDICQISMLPSMKGEVTWHDPAELPGLPRNYHHRPEESRTFQARIRRSERRVAHANWDDLDWQLYRMIYFRYCNMVDSTLGLILDGLEASGEAENTLLVYTSDHGEGNGHHRLATKSFLYEESVRVPFTAVWPGRLPAGQSDSRIMISGMDLMPTFCRAAGIPQPQNLPGSDFLKEYESGAPSREYVVAEAAAGGHMVRSERYKYIKYDGDPFIQLFDLREDPEETTNLADRPELAATVTLHAEMLSDFHDRLET